MDKIFIELQQVAIQIAEKYPAPAFYRDFSDAVGESAQFFEKDAVIWDLREFVADNIENDYGHGLAHVHSVALDAGALIMIETGHARSAARECARDIRLAQGAGLLHDIKRKEKDHAAAGSRYARRVLGDYPFSEAEIEEICLAIGNHEAFGTNERAGSESGRLLSDCLYDADKFRWGPENFTHTIWGMVSYLDVTLDRFLEHYPKGMAFLKKIKTTFRTETGRRYGPQFIDLGIAIGEELYGYIRKEFAGNTPSP